MLEKLSASAGLTAADSNATFAALGSVLGYAGALQGADGAQPPLPVALGSAVLATVSNLVLAGSGHANGGCSASNGTNTATAASAGGALALLSSAALNASDGSSSTRPVVSYTSLPPAEAAAPLYCGPSLAMSASLLPSGSAAAAPDLVLPIAGAMPPCSSACAAPAAVTLPAALVAAAPPPSVTIPGALLAQLAGSPLYAGASLSVVQWGVSPFPQAAGTGIIPYAALVKPGTLAAAADAAAAAAAGAPSGAGSSRASSLRALGILPEALTDTLSSLLFTLSAAAAAAPPPYPLSAAGATVSANTVLRVVAPRPTVAYDLLPARPMDSRVVSIGLSSRSGEALPLQQARALTFNSSAGLFSVTLPILDLSIVRLNASAPPGTPPSINVGTSALRTLALTVTCPRSAAEVVAQGVRAVYAAPPALAGRRAQVALLSVNGVTFAQLTQSEAVGAVAPSAVSFGSSTLSSDGASGGTALGAAASSASGSSDASTFTTTTSGTTFALSTDCGPPFGNLTFLCGPGTAGSAVAFTCPTAQAVPACLTFDTAAGTWRSGGCAVTAFTATAVTCACDHLGHFALRFPALQLNDNDLFAVEAPVTVVQPSPMPLLLLGVCCALLGAAALAQCAACGAEDRFRERYARALSGDEEVQWLERATRASGGEWVLDAWAGEGGGGWRRRQRAKVAPLEPAPSEALPLPQGGAEVGAQAAFAASLTARGSEGSARPLARALALLLGKPLQPLQALLLWTPLPLQARAAAAGAGEPVPAQVELEHELAAAQQGAPAIPAHLKPLLAGLVQSSSQRSPSTAAAALPALLISARVCTRARLAPALCGLLPHTDAKRTARLDALALFAWLACSLYVCAGLLVYCFGVPGSAALPTLSAFQLWVLACVASLCLPLLSGAVWALRAWGGEGAWRARYPALAAELARRRAAAALLARVPTQVLFGVVAGAVQRVPRAQAWALLPPHAPRQLLEALAAEPPSLPLALASPAAAALRTRQDKARARAPPAPAPAAAAALARPSFVAPDFAPPNLKDVFLGAHARASVVGVAKDAPAAAEDPHAADPAAVTAAALGPPSHAAVALAAVAPRGAAASLARQAPLATGPGLTASDSELQQQWEEEAGWAPPPRLCQRHCGGLLAAWGRAPAEAREAFQQWQREDARPPEALLEEEEELGGAHEGSGLGSTSASDGPASASELMPLLQAGWTESMLAPQGPALPAAALAHALLGASLLLALYFLIAFGLLRSDAAARTLLGVWVLALVLYYALLLPALVALGVLLQLRLWPAAAEALAVVPWLGRATGARAWVAAARRPVLPALQTVAGRLELVVGALGSAAAAGMAPAGALAEAAPLGEVGAALHSAARARGLLGAGAEGALGEAARAAAAARHTLLCAAVALAVSPGALPELPQRVREQLEEEERERAAEAAAAAAAAAAVAAAAAEAAAAAAALASQQLLSTRQLQQRPPSAPSPAAAAPTANAPAAAAAFAAEPPLASPPAAAPASPGAVSLEVRLPGVPEDAASPAPPLLFLQPAAAPAAPAAAATAPAPAHLPHDDALDELVHGGGSGSGDSPAAPAAAGKVPPTEHSRKLVLWGGASVAAAAAGGGLRGGGRGVYNRAGRAAEGGSPEL